MDPKKSKLLFRILCFIHQFYNLLIAYKVTFTRFANILKVARAEQTEGLFWADADSPWVQSLLAPPCLSQKDSRIIYERGLGAVCGSELGLYLSFLFLKINLFFY